MNAARLIGFSDAVFAFVITFMFLDIRLPDVVPSLAMLWSQSARMGVFLLTFWIVGTYWVAHHMILGFAKTVDRRLLYLNLLLLLCIVLIPLPTKMLAEYPSNRVAIACYGAVLSLANLFGTAIWLRVTADARGATARQARSMIAAIHAAPIVVYVAAMAVATVSPICALVLYVCVPAFLSLPNPWLEKRTRAALRVLHPAE